MIEEIKKFVRANYPESAFYVVVKFNSEYNDNTYDNSVVSLAVYDTGKEELLPLKACTDKITELLSGIHSSETSEPREEMVVIL